MRQLADAIAVLRAADAPRPPAAAPVTPGGRVTLDYEGRFLRRKRLVTEAGDDFLVDLPETTSLEAGDFLVLADGGLVEIAAAAEPVVEIRGALTRLAWHIGNRHTPCQIGADHLVIRADHVLERMLTGLGASMLHRMAAFTPEGGAYGHGRTLGHSHGHDHGHDHDHGHGRSHDASPPPTAFGGRQSGDGFAALDAGPQGLSHGRSE